MFSQGSQLTRAVLQTAVLGAVLFNIFIINLGKE